ncbi:hypothetical protein GGR54DRAFT_263994 [Hypoxylon sp. NC1633]|nr:hypothetical protein GGR54DRAFT_263994 [Hypoxylon sp. NC1633]
MVNGFERLERLFGGARKKDRDRGTRNRDLSFASSPSQLENGLSFPPPSFMNPTSKHMKPRLEPSTLARLAKDRSQSLPDPHGHLRRRSSIGSTSTVTNHRHHPSDPIRSLSIFIKESEDSLYIQKLSSFRFPENSLSENESTEVPRNDGTSKVSTFESHDELRVENILDWCPQRMSSLLSSLDLETSIDSCLTKPTENETEVVTLRPSPILSAPPSPRTRVSSVVIPPRDSSRRSSEVFIPDLTILPRSNLVPSFSATRPDSPPPSDGEECTDDLFKRSIPAKALGSPIQFTPRLSLDSNPRNDSTEVIACRQSIRESWGARFDDPTIPCTALGESGCDPQSRVVRRSASEGSLSTITRYIAPDRSLEEPTIDDFYALEDGDIAESIPNTPELELDVPPTPPPKDDPKTPIGRSRSTRHAPIAPTTAINSSSGELTPPRTPTDSQFLTLTYSPTRASGALGARWAANIAHTYNFDLVYVISLWPKGQESDPSPSYGSTSQTQASNLGHIASQCAIVGHPKSRMTGRLLAGYGLNQFGSPFRIHTQFHTMMLGSKGWREYRDELASPGMISRGWTCSFYSDHMPVIRSGTTGDRPVPDVIVNRGIVFAAYTRKTTTSKIPVRSSPKQTAILGRLMRDAQTFVDGLIHGA